MFAVRKVAQINNLKAKFAPNLVDNICPRRLDPFYIVSYYIKWVRVLGQTDYPRYVHRIYNLGRIHYYYMSKK